MNLDHTTPDVAARSSHDNDVGVPSLLVAVAFVLLAAVGAIVAVSQTSSMWTAALGLGAILASTGLVLTVIGRQLADEQ